MKEVQNQKSIDMLLKELDGTPNKCNLGANAILGVSVACLKAAALDNNEEVYMYLNKREAKIPFLLTQGTSTSPHTGSQARPNTFFNASAAACMHTSPL